VKRLYGIDVVRRPTPTSSAAEATAQIAAEKAAGNDTTGRVGLIWTNGLNFLEQTERGLLYGPWAYKVPNAANFDFSDPAVGYDFGIPTAGFELPYNQAQVVFIYNPNCTGLNSGPPQTMTDLVTWIKSNPGKFTYANPGNATGDFTGSVFIRHFLYEFTGGYQQYYGKHDFTLYKQKVSAAFAQLRSIDPFLYRLQSTTTAYYPSSQLEVDNLFATGDICINLSYNPSQVGLMIHTAQPNGTLNWPEGVKAYVPTSGTIGNVNFIAISYNCKALLGSLVTANFIASMGAQYKRREVYPPGIGVLQPFSLKAAAIVDGGWDYVFDDLPDFSETPSHHDLNSRFLPEIDSHYTVQMQIDWWWCIAKNMTTAPVVYGGSGCACF